MTEKDSPINVIIHPVSGECENAGLTKRELFATNAMKGFLANPSETEITSTYVLERLGLPKETKYDFEKHYTKYVAKIAVSYADSLIAELNVEVPNSGVVE